MVFVMPSPSFQHDQTSLEDQSHHHLPVGVKHKQIRNFGQCQKVSKNSKMEEESTFQMSYEKLLIKLLIKKLKHQDRTFSPFLPCFPSGPGLPSPPYKAKCLSDTHTQWFDYFAIELNHSVIGIITDQLLKAIYIISTLYSVSAFLTLAPAGPGKP